MVESRSESKVTVIDPDMNGGCERMSIAERQLGAVWQTKRDNGVKTTRAAVLLRMYE